MNRTPSIQPCSRLMNRLLKCLWFGGILCLISGQPARAADAFFVNYGTIDYPLTTNTVPEIDATNFVNNGNFIVDFTEYTTLYETHDTLNFTNIGYMECNLGFEFDLDTSANSPSMAANINNSGTITCGLDFSAWATNILNPGTVDAGQDGVIYITGQNVNLSGGTVNMAGATANTSGSGSDGTNVITPASDFTAQSATSPYLSIVFPNVYTNQVIDPVTTNNIDRYVFIQDSSPQNISYAVYFNNTNQTLGSGDVTIQWTGVFQDTASGNFETNYLYLNDNYLLGASTNVSLLGGYPNNFTITTTTTPQLANSTPTASSTAVSFPPGAVTNLYSYGDLSVLAGSASTNSIINGALTNFTGRMVLAGSNELNLSGATISGANYISVQAPNQLDDNPGALLDAPYYDLNLGSTNGFLTSSNLLTSVNPNFSGTIQAYNTEWTEVGTNGLTNDFRVLIVSSDLSPTTLAQVQNLLFHATNSLLLSDSFNVMNTVGADSQNLTLTTNGFGTGAGSVAGELNVQNPNFVWSAAFPNLLNLTNYGVINLQSLGQFISSSNIVNIVSNTAATPATGTLVEIAGHTNVAASDSVTVGVTQYTFVGKPTNAIANQVAIAGTFNGSLSNLIAAINLGAGKGTAYSSNTAANPLATAGPFVTNGFTVSAIVIGPNGNNIPIGVSSANVTWGGNTTLTGGANAIPGSTNSTPTPTWLNNFVNYDSISDQGSLISAVNFYDSGVLDNGNNSFQLESTNAILADDFVFAPTGDVSLEANSLTIEGNYIQSGRSLTLQAPNITDGVTGGGGPVSNGNNWSVGGAASSGLNLPIPPVSGGLLGTTITLTAPANRKVYSTWAGNDLGAASAGFQNNAAIGQLVLTNGISGQFIFNGVGTDNALYVDELELTGTAANLDSHGDPLGLTNAANLTIYYAQALSNGVSVAQALDHKNNNHLRWVSSYAGHFSSTAVVANGSTNYVNSASLGDTSLLQFSTNLFVTATSVSQPTNSVKLTWFTIPSAVNAVQYTTNLQSPWVTLSNYNAFYYGTGVVVSVSNPGEFTSPQSSSGPKTNVWIYDALTNSVQRFYRVVVYP